MLDVQTSTGLLRDCGGRQISPIANERKTGQRGTTTEAVDSRLHRLERNNYDKQPK
jgi:hypothetical protein